MLSEDGSQNLLFLGCSYIFTAEEGFNNPDKVSSTTKLCHSKVPKTEFKSAVKHIKTALQHYMLRYVKVLLDIVGNFILAVLQQNLNEKDYVYRKKM